MVLIILASIFFAVFVGISIWKSPSAALGQIIPVAAALPVWIILPLFDTKNDTLYGSGLDLKTAVGSACLLVYSFLPGRKFPLRPAPLDCAVVLMILVAVVADCLADGFSWLVIARAYAEWYMPYLLGRLAIQSFAEADSTARACAVVAVVLAVIAAVEALSGTNALELIFGQRPREGFSLEASRWGMKRAYGNCMHPIYFGVIGVLLAAWPGYLTINALRRKASPVWLFTLPSVAAWMFATGSRGPVAALVFAVLGASFVAIRRTRLPILGLGIAVVAFAALNLDSTFSLLEKWGNPNAKRRVIEIDGEGRDTSGTLNRLNIWRVYKIAAGRAGLFGFGTESVTSFPVNVPVGPAEVKTLKQTKYIDNVYLLLTLRYGYLGVGVFSIAALLAVAQLVMVHRRMPGRSPGNLAACLAGSLLGTYAVMMTVWMPPDYGFFLVWTWGVSSGLWLCVPRERAVASECEGRP